MKLLTKALAKILPAYGAQEKVPLEDHIFYACYFSIISNWHWYACEYDPESRTFFGYVMGQENEWGDFSLDEMMACRVGGTLPVIERDLYWTPITFRELEALHDR